MKNGKNIKEPPKNIFVLLMLVIITLVGIATINISSKKSEYTYHDDNIEVLGSIVGDKMAEELLIALESTSCIEKNHKISLEDIVDHKNLEYDIYVGLSVHAYIYKNQVKLYTFDTVYNENSAILLYDSENKTAMKVLDETERSSLIQSQRRYQVTSTIQILPRIGVITHDRLGNSSISFTVKNVSDTTFSYIQLKITPGFLGYTSDYKTKNYSSYESIFVGKSKEFNLTTTGWTDYDLFEITEVIIYFSDGTSVMFNEYDCQFLSQ